MLQTSYEAKTKDVWVFIETKDGKARNVGLELLNPGVELAHQFAWLASRAARRLLWSSAKTARTL